MQSWNNNADAHSADQQAKPGTAAFDAVLGLMQGIALWLFYVAGRDKLWPALSPGLLAALTHFALVAPLVWFLTAGGLLGRAARAGVAVGIGLLMAFFAWHALSTDSHASYGPTSFAAGLGMLALTHVLVALLTGFDPRARRFVYPRLFELAWRNALLVPVAAVLTGIFWVLLWAAAWVLGAIGIGWLATALRAAPTIIIGSATVFALATHLALRKSAALVALRHFWLSLNTWFLPLALVLAVLSVVAVAVLGIEGLFATQRAAFFLFWFAALAVLFVNAAYQDGSEPPALLRPIARLVPWTWLALPVVTLLGAWAMGTRVHQHGWTPDRIWGALVGLLGTLYAFGYAVSLRSRGGWMNTIAPTNILVAILMSSCLAALLSPLADPRKLSVASQLARLSSGATPAKDFDFAFLARGAGSYGREALRVLAESSTSADVRTRAAEARANERPPRERHEPEVALAALRQVRVLPQGASVGPELLQWLSRQQADWSERTCIIDPARCLIWIVDADGRGPAEAVLIWNQPGTTYATLYAQEDLGWRRQGELHGGSVALADWVAGIENGTIRWVQPRWQDVLVKENRRMQVR